MDKALPVYQMLMDKAMADMNVNERRKCLTYLIDSVVQKEGIDKAIALIQKYDAGMLGNFKRTHGLIDTKAEENAKIAKSLEAAQAVLDNPESKGKVKAFTDMLNI